MKTDFDAVSASALSDVMDQARQAQGAHGARLIAAAVRKIHQAVSRAIVPDGVGSASRLRLH